jgi:hypothetical protein
MIGWLLDDPAGIAVLTVIAATLVTGAMWAALFLAATVLVAVVQFVRRRSGRGHSLRSANH